MGTHGCAYPAEHPAVRGALANVLEPLWFPHYTMVCGQVRGRPLSHGISLLAGPQSNATWVSQVSCNKLIA